jgi:hypothetical protein
MGPVTSIPAPIQQDLGKWTRAVIQDLVSAGRLPEKAIPDENAPDRFYPVDPDLWETVARGLEWYLSHSGNYTYSLNLDRADAKIDPTLDFLFNTRSGHCNRFASALALMLRSVRIPSQVVLGYRGADSKGEGRYEVRQCYAHTWVEVLVTRHDAGGNLYMHWLSLDPTPEEASDEAVAVGNRWWSTGFDFRKSYRNLIVNFTIENRDEFFNDVAAAARTLWSAGRKALMAHTPEGFRLRIAAGLFGLVLLTGLVHVTRWARRRALARRGPSPSPLTAFYRRLLVILARQGWTPGAAQTSREFADDVAQRLQQRGRAEMAAIVCHASKLFDRVRYGAAPLSEEESLRMDAELDQLARDLATSAN